MMLSLVQFAVPQKPTLCCPQLGAPSVFLISFKGPSESAGKGGGVGRGTKGKQRTTDENIETRFGSEATDSGSCCLTSQTSGIHPTTGRSTSHPQINQTPWT